MLDLVDKALHQMTLTVQPRVIIARLLAALVRWDDGFSPCFKYNVDKVLTCVASVSNYMLTSKPISHFNRFGTVVALTCGQVYPQWVAQAIGTNVNLGAKTAATSPQCLVSLPAAFFVRLLHRGEHEPRCCPAANFPYPGLGQSAQTSLAKSQRRTSAKSACKRYSNSRKHSAAVATVPRFAASTVRLRQSVGICALNPSRCLCLAGEISRFSASARQLVVSSCGYYATNVNTS